MENKSYFAQLTELVNNIEINDRVTQYIVDDVMHRTLSYRLGHDEDIQWDNSTYMKRQLAFLNEWLDSNK